MNNIDIGKDYFSEHIESFTIYVVEHKFADNQGHDFFRQYIDKEHYINSNNKIQQHLTKVLSWIQKKIPDIGELTKNMITYNAQASPLGLVDIITSLNKLFTITEHQAVGPDVIDPIIIEEVNISQKYISQLISLYRESIIQPAIIIILRDNNFNRAKTLLSNCPHNTNVKLIRNSGETEIYKIINTGADNIKDFIDAFSRHCFSTCSKTNRSVLLSQELQKDTFIQSISPFFFKTRTNLLYDEKPEAITDINYTLNRIDMEKKQSGCNPIIIDSLELMAKLNRIYCLDNGGNDIVDAMNLAKKLDIEVLTAHVYRYASFIPGISKNQQIELLSIASQIFENNNIADHAVYCQNNMLLNSFYTDRVEARQFHDLQQRAANEVPGLVGMSIILNNTGVAHLYKRDYSEANIYFQKGLDYSKERIVQKIGIKNNMLINKACAYKTLAENEIKMQLDIILSNFTEKYLPFIAANYLMNLLAISLEQNYELAIDIFNNPKVKKIISAALTDNALGSGSLTQQIVRLHSRFPEVPFSDFNMPNHISQISGVRAEFIMEKGYNPIIFSAWL